MLDATQQIIEKKLSFMLLPDIYDIDSISDYAKNIYKYQIQCLNLRTLEEINLLRIVIRKYIQKVCTNVNAEIYRRYEKPRRKSTARLDREVQEMKNWLAFYKYAQELYITKKSETEVPAEPQYDQIKQLIKKIAALPLCSGYISFKTAKTKKVYLFGLKEELINNIEKTPEENHDKKIKEIYKALVNADNQNQGLVVLNSEQENRTIKKQSGIEYDLKRMRSAFTEEIKRNKEMENNYINIIKLLLEDMQAEMKDTSFAYIVMFNNKSF